MEYAKLKWLGLFILLFLFVLGTNYQVITFDMVYPEQPLMYLANQKISGIRSLLSVYLHPALFHLYIPFFRPSGHFLMYQILTPIFGWDKSQSFIIVNLLFLALSGFMIVKIYQELFAGRVMGGFIAFTIYLSHPSLNLARLTIMHFEYAYILFCLLGLYYFIRFCKTQKGFKRSLLFYVIAVTFKESAVMLGGIYLSYLLFNQIKMRTMPAKKIMTTIGIVTIFGILLSSYILAARIGSSANDSIPQLTNKSLFSFYVFLNSIFDLPIPLSISQPIDNVWQSVIYPSSYAFLFILLGYIALSGIYHSRQYTKSDNLSILFLFISSLLFLIIPLLWAAGMPWHFSLTLLMLCFIFGFYSECFIYRRYPKNALTVSTIFAILIGLMTLLVNYANISKYTHNPENRFAFKILHNAIKNPPTLPKLTANSLLVVEDSLLNNAYILGAAVYPFYLANQNDFEKYRIAQNNTLLKINPLYNGSLFRYAYKLPSLREEVFPFQVEFMQTVDAVVIYHWLANFNNIYCVGYDDNGNWIDRTAAFKHALLSEKQRRHIAITQYQTVKIVSYDLAKIISLPFPDMTQCQFRCDQNSHCVGYTYQESNCRYYYKFNNKATFSTYQGNHYRKVIFRP